MGAYSVVLELMISGVMVDSLGCLFGYLDPGAGSVVLQFLVAGLLSVLVALKAYWHSIVHFIGMILGSRKTIETNSEENLADTDEQTDNNVDKKAA
jgi:hypothetical protein